MRFSFPVFKLEHGSRCNTEIAVKTPDDGSYDQIGYAGEKRTAGAHSIALKVARSGWVTFPGNVVYDYDE